MSDHGVLSDPLLSGLPAEKGVRLLGGVALAGKLGQGAMGAVYRGRHRRLGVDVAVKIMLTRPGLPDSQVEAQRQRFLREARTAAAIDHPNLVRVLDVDERDGIQFIVMQLVEGQSAAHLAAYEGRLSEAEAVRICREAAEGLAAAHRLGIVHRDVKPANILIDREGRVKVADMGLAKAFRPGGPVDLADLTMSETLMGTPYYMAPEQTRSSALVGPQADVWALGVTLFELITGERPFLDSDIPDLIQKIRNEPAPDVRGPRPDVSPVVAAIIDAALQKDPAARYGDCGDMAAALAACQGESSARAPPPPPIAANARTGAFVDAETVAMGPMAPPAPADSPLERALGVARGVERSGRHDGVTSPARTKKEVEAFRDKVRDRIARHNRESDDTIEHASPWVWTEKSGGRPLTESGRTYGVELRISYQKNGNGLMPKK